jgi:hypothetical protein
MGWILNGLAGPEAVLASGIKVLTMSKRGSLAYPSLASECVARKPGQNGRKAGDGVTGRTCETPGERSGGWKPTR